MTHPQPLRIEPIAGYSPAIGRLVCMMTYSRATTLAAVDGLTTEALDHLFDAESNSIGALLAHIAAVERSYQILTFEERLLSSDENAQLGTALALGPAGRQSLRGFNAYWARFHVAEDEINHRGQIRWLRARTAKHMR